MSEIDRDLQSRLKQLADEVGPNAARESIVLDRSRSKRRLVALTSGLMSLLLIGGIAGASMLWSPNQQGPDPSDEGTDADKVFARYFFETGSRDASASGVLEVNSQEGTLCYEATTENVQASHLLRNAGVVAGGRRFERRIVVTFFDPDDREQGAELPSGAPICFQDEQLGELEGDLQVLIDDPEDFRVDFHRGPNDDPGLVAGLQVSPDKGRRADYYIEDDPGLGVHVPEGWQVASQSLTPNLGDPREILSLGTAPMRPGGSCAQQPVRALDALGPTDAFISIQERRSEAGNPPRPRSFQAKLEDRFFNIELCTDADDFKPYWFAFNDAGRDFYLLAALGADASAQRTRQFWEVLDSLDFEAPYGDDQRPSRPNQPKDVVYYTLNRDQVDRYCGAYDRSYVERPVEVPEGQNSVLTHALRALFRNEWNTPPSTIERVELVKGRAVVYLKSADGVEFASTSCGGVGFLGSILRTSFQFDSVESVEIRLGGSCEAFGEFMQTGRCDVFRRQHLRGEENRRSP